MHDHKIFAYCERAKDPHFWAEPFNAITNLAFIIAALSAFYLIYKQDKDNRDTIYFALASLVFIIGVGSFLFHTFANRWSLMADVLPITAFIFTYLTFSIVRFLNFNLVGTAIALLGFVGLTYGIGQIKCDGEECFNGTLSYAPALIALFIISTILLIRGHKAGKYILTAGIVFFISTVFRTIDFITCDTIKIGDHQFGTHFMWHIMNAITLFILLYAAIFHGQKHKKKPQI